MSASVAAIDARREQAIVLLAALSWLAALIHAALAPVHWSEWPPFAVCFAVVALAQAGWAVAFFRAPSRRLLVGNGALSAGLIAVWALSRTAGLPVGPEAGDPEAVGLADVGACAVEAVLVAAALGLASRRLLRLGYAALLVGGLGLVAGCAQ